MTEEIGEMSTIDFAPVVIPTLNRINHLKRCIDSIKGNSICKYTDLYISVDFPPDEKYVAGRKAVLEYVKGIEGFKKKIIYVQQRNLGAIGNAQFLIDEVGKVYNKFIFTEDDNEFSSNCLEYINYYLDKYNNNPNIFAVCASGFLMPNNIRGMGDYYLSYHYSSYVVGRWCDKDKRAVEFLKQDFPRDKSLKTLKQIIVLAKRNPMAYKVLRDFILGYIPIMGDIDGEINMIDFVESIYCTCTKNRVVLPTVPKARTWGYDGSGVNCGRVENFRPKPIDSQSRYVERKMENIDIISKRSNRWILKSIKLESKEFLKTTYSYFVFFILSPQAFSKYREIFRLAHGEGEAKINSFWKSLVLEIKILFRVFFLNETCQKQQRES